MLLSDFQRANPQAQAKVIKNLSNARQHIP